VLWPGGLPRQAALLCGTPCTPKARSPCSLGGMSGEGSPAAELQRGGRRDHRRVTKDPPDRVEEVWGYRYVSSTVRRRSSGGRGDELCTETRGKKKSVPRGGRHWEQGKAAALRHRKEENLSRGTGGFPVKAEGKRERQRGSAWVCGREGGGGGGLASAWGTRVPIAPGASDSHRRRAAALSTTGCHAVRAEQGRPAVKFSICLSIFQIDSTKSLPSLAQKFPNKIWLCT
jgi:hypothetical protein